MKKLTFYILWFMLLLPHHAQGQPMPTKQAKVYFICPPCENACDTMHFDSPGICPVCGMQLYAAYSGYENKAGANNTQVHKNVAILVWPGVEIIDFAGPYEVFGQAGMNVYTVGEKQTQIETNMHLKIVPEYSFANAPKPDILVLPGGSTDQNNPAILQWIRKTDSATDHTMSVCNGAFYLAAAGLLNNLKATTYYSLIPILQNIVPKATVLDTVRFADNGHIITSAGLSSGIDAALHVVSLYLGPAATKKIANDLEYNWSYQPTYVRGKMADKYLQGFLDVFTPFDHKITIYQGSEADWQAGVTLNTTLSAAQLTSLLGYEFEEGQKWVKQGAQTWQFTRANVNWRAVLEVTGPEQGFFSVLLTLQKM